MGRWLERGELCSNVFWKACMKKATNLIMKRLEITKLIWGLRLTWLSGLKVKQDFDTFVPVLLQMAVNILLNRIQWLVVQRWMSVQLLFLPGCIYITLSWQLGLKILIFLIFKEMWGKNLNIILVSIMYVGQWVRGVGMLVCC